MIKRLLIICLLLLVPISVNGAGTSPYIYGIAGQPPAEEGPPAATITGSYTTIPASLDLPTEGTTDWYHFALAAASDRNSKDGASVLTDVSITGTPVRGAASTVGPPISWTGGTPTASAGPVQTQVYVSASAAEQGFEWAIPVAADGVARVAKFYLRAGFGTGPYTFEATLTGATTYTDSGWSGSTASNRVYTVSYSSTDPDAELSVTFSTTNGIVAVQAVTLSTDGDGDGGGEEPPPPLIYVRTPENGGSDTSPGDGTDEHPYATIPKALSVATSGDTVVIGDGAFGSGALTVPAGVSIISESQDYTKVRIYPTSTLSTASPFILFDNASPGGTGNQTLSYVEIDGIDGAYSAKVAVRIKNRNNVDIHHCSFHDFYGAYGSTAIKLESSQIAYTTQWWTVWPKDVQAVGTDTSINALWPTNPVKDCNIYKNKFVDCGYKGSVDYVNGAIEPFNTEDCTIHDNYFDCSSSNSGQAIYKTTAFLKGTDIYNNVMIGRKFIDRSTYLIELWLTRDCEIYGNTLTQGGFSIAYGKQTAIYNNDIRFTEWNDKGIGIESIGQNYSSIHNNYVDYAPTFGIDAGKDDKGGGGWIVTDINIYRNVLARSRFMGIMITAHCTTAGQTNTTKNVYLYNNVIANTTAGRTSTGIDLREVVATGTGDLKDIYIKNNVFYHTVSTAYGIYQYAGVSNVTVTYNQFFGVTTQWSAGTPSNSLTTNPLFINPGTDFNGYKLQTIAGGYSADSPCLDSGTDTGVTAIDAIKVNSVLDRGAHEYGAD